MAVEALASVSADDISDLEDDDLIYLLQRNRFVDQITAELERRDIDPHSNNNAVHQLQSVPNFGDANTKNAPVPKTREEGEADPSYLDKFETKPENLTEPQLVGLDDDDDDDDDFEIPDNRDYDEWKNDQLRAELQRRANEGDYTADLDGKKSVLADRLREQDAANEG